MILGLLVLRFAGLLWIGAGLNKTHTGLLEPLVAIVGFLVLGSGFIRRVR